MPGICIESGIDLTKKTTDQYMLTGLIFVEIASYKQTENQTLTASKRMVLIDNRSMSEEPIFATEICDVTPKMSTALRVMDKCACGSQRCLGAC